MAGHKSLKDSAKENPTALGDPVSLKAEKSDNEPTEKDRPNKQEQSVQAPAPTEQDLDKSEGSSSGGKEKKSLKELAQQDLAEAKKGNKTMLGDPTSLKAETVDRDPTQWAVEDGTGRTGATPMKKKDSKL